MFALAARRALLVTSMLLAACSDPEPGTECERVQGTCVIGGGDGCSKLAESSAQDCNPDKNPGGAICCLELAPQAQ